MKKIIILVIVILFTACSVETEESALNSVITNSSVKAVQTSSTETTAESSRTEASISEATTKIAIQDWEFNLDGLSDRLIDIVIKDQSRGFIPPAQYSLFDLDFDGNPELIASHTDMGIHTIHELYNLISGQTIGSTVSICKKENGSYSTELTDIFAGIYYIDSETYQRYFIQSGLSKWGSDGYTNIYRKNVIEDGLLINIETINFPLEEDGEPIYDPEEHINLFAPEDECRELYMKSVLVEYIHGETESELRGRIKTAMEQLVSDYYSSLEYNVDE